VFLLAGGLTGFKNCTSTCIQTFAVASLISVTWLVFGYSLAFGHNWDGTKNDFIGGANMFWFWGDGKGIPFFPACKIIICLPVCNFALSSELDRGRRAEACVCCIAST
jgi:ammonia channel protein AmtB